MNGSAWSHGLVVAGGWTGVVSHAGSVLLRRLADKTGLTAGLPAALASPRLLVHDRGLEQRQLAAEVGPLPAGEHPGASDTAGSAP